MREVFRVFEDARNLAKITPPWLRFEVLSGEVAMRRGAEIDYVIRWQGLPMKWKTLITNYDPPDSFVDLQVRGPYRVWHHRHSFRETAEGTVVEDRVDYALPLGLLGRAAHCIVVKRQLLAIFRYRQTAMGRLLGVVCRELDEPRIVGTPTG